MKISVIGVYVCVFEVEEWFSSSLATLIPLSNFQNRLIIVTIVDTRTHSQTSKTIHFQISKNVYCISQQDEGISFTRQSCMNLALIIFLLATKCSAHASTQEFFVRRPSWMNLSAGRRGQELCRLGSNQEREGELGIKDCDYH